MVFIRNLVGGLLAELEDDINHDKFKRLLHYSRRLAAFKNRATLVCLVVISPISTSFFVYRSRKPWKKFWNRAGLDHYCYQLALILRTDEDLNAMYLTDKKNGTPHDMHEHDELEVLLEFFSKQVEEIVNEAENIEVRRIRKADSESQLIDITKANVQSTQEIVELILDSNRNALLALDLKVCAFSIKTNLLYLEHIRSLLEPWALDRELSLLDCSE